MSRRFHAAIRRATDATRRGEPARATRIIQAALTGAAAEPDCAPMPLRRAPSSIRRRVPRAAASRERLRDRSATRSGRSGRAAQACTLARADARCPHPPCPRRPIRRGASPAQQARALQALRPALTAAALAADRHAPRLQAEPDDFAAGTRMNALAEEHGCSCLSRPDRARTNPSRCWNWFRPERPASRHRRTGDPRRHDARDQAQRARHPAGPGVRRRPVGRRRDGGGHGRGVPGPLRRGRHPLRASPAGGARCALRFRRDARRGRRSPAAAGPSRASPASDDRVPRGRRRHGASRQRRCESWAAAPARRREDRAARPADGGYSPPGLAGPAARRASSCWLVEGAGPRLGRAARRRRLLHRPLAGRTPRRRCCSLWRRQAPESHGGGRGAGLGRGCSGGRGKSQTEPGQRRVKRGPVLQFEAHRQHGEGACDRKEAGGVLLGGDELRAAARSSAARRASRSGSYGGDRRTARPRRLRAEARGGCRRTSPGGRSRRRRARAGPPGHAGRSRGASTPSSWGAPVSGGQAERRRSRVVLGTIARTGRRAPGPRRPARAGDPPETPGRCRSRTRRRPPRTTDPWRGPGSGSRRPSRCRCPAARRPRRGGAVARRSRPRRGGEQQRLVADVGRDVASGVDPKRAGELPP